jgi:hypothetical protein
MKSVERGIGTRQKEKKKLHQLTIFLLILILRKWEWKTSLFSVHSKDFLEKT